MATLLVLMSLVQFTLAASEVQGTLSSDGTHGASQQSGNAGGGAAAGQVLSGTVMGGTENADARNAAAIASVAGNSTTFGLMSALIPITLVILAGAGFFLYKRGV